MAKRNPSNKGKEGARKSFGKFMDRKSNPRTEKKNDKRKEKTLLERMKKKGSGGTWIDEGPIRLNRFIALSGVCSRREADELIKSGQIKVNGEKTTEMGLKVRPGKDKVVFANRVLKIRKFEYLLMNKPKNHITTVKDDQGRKTVMDLVKKYSKARLYPVGRLDRNTTGLLLFTNDGELTEKLTHPSFQVSKIYQVRLDRDVSEADMDQLKKGIELEDGFIKADHIGYVDGGNPNEVGLEIHSGRNRIVRRMFEHFDYRIVALDRIQFGPLTKRGLSRGTCRLLEEKEIGWLKMLK